MKIAFDEHIPEAMVRTFKTLAKERQFRRLLGAGSVVSAKDYAPKPTDRDYVKKSDVPWLKRFKADGGDVLITGDTNMPHVPLELLAIHELRLIAFFFPAKWNNLDFYKKSAFLLINWKRIVEQAKVSKPGSLFRLPLDWTAEEPLLIINRPGPLRLPETEHPVRPKPAHLARTPIRRSRRPADVEEPGLLALMRQPSPSKK